MCVQPRPLASGVSKARELLGLWSDCSDTRSQTLSVHWGEQGLVAAADIDNLREQGRGKSRFAIPARVEPTPPGSAASQPSDRVTPPHIEPQNLRSKIPRASAANFTAEEK